MRWWCLVFVCLSLSHCSFWHSGNYHLCCFSNQSRKVILKHWSSSNSADSAVAKPQHRSLPRGPHQASTGLARRHRRLLKRQLLKLVRRSGLRKEPLHYSFAKKHAHAFQIRSVNKVVVDISMKIKTHRKNALLLLVQRTTGALQGHSNTSHKDHSNHKQQPYAFLELLYGRLRFTLDYGRVFEASLDSVVSDGLWHQVSVVWSGGQLMLAVDGAREVREVEGLVALQMAHYFRRSSRQVHAKHNSSLKWHLHLAAVPPSGLLPKKVRAFCSCTALTKPSNNFVAFQ